MARAKKDALANYDEEMAKQAAVAAAMEESTAGGQFFSLKSGQLSFNDAPLPNNEMAAVVVDSVLENVHYEGEYDPDVPQGPSCFAFGRADEDMAPHEKASNPQHKTCEGCPNNEWGSADTGRGKACSNTRRLALISAGNLDDRTGAFEPNEDPAHYASTPLAFMKLPVTSVKAYAAMVKSVAATLRRPPHGIFVRVKVVPDKKSQFKVVFEPLDKVPASVVGAVMKRHEEAMAVIDFPYAAMDGDEGDGPKKGKKGKKRKY